MRRSVLLVAMSALVVCLALGAAQAGDLPLTASSALEGRDLRPEEHLLMAVPMRIFALGPNGTASPAQNILAPVEAVPAAPGSYKIPPCWLYVVEPGAGPGSPVDLDHLAKALKSFEIPGVSLRMQQGVNDAFLKRIAGLETLEYLGLARTRVTDAGLKHVASMPRLLALDLRSLPTLTDAGLATLAAHPSLVALNLSGAGGGMGRLTDEGVLSIATLPNLIWLDLTQSGVTDDGLLALTKRGRIQVLELGQCTGVTDVGILSLANVRSLRALGLASVPLTDRALKKLAKSKSLEALDLAMTQVTEKGLASLKSLKQLSWLSLSGLPVGDKAVSWLKASKGIATLDLTDTQVTVKGLQALKGKATLRELRLRGPALTDDGLEIAATCGGLERLYLHNADVVTDEGILHLASLGGLTTFGITAAPNLTDASLDVLAGLKGLTWVNLDRCTGLTKAGVAKLRAALPGCQVIDPWQMRLR